MKFFCFLPGVLGAVPLESPKGIKRVISHLHCHSGELEKLQGRPFGEKGRSPMQRKEKFTAWLRKKLHRGREKQTLCFQFCWPVA